MDEKKPEDEIPPSEENREGALPLNYATTELVRPRVLSLFLGLTCGLIIIAFLGGVLFIKTFNDRGGAPTQWPLALFLAGVALVAAVRLVILLRRRTPTTKSWFGIGVLIGIAVAALVEGACFGGFEL